MSDDNEIAGLEQEKKKSRINNPVLTEKKLEEQNQKLQDANKKYQVLYEELLEAKKHLDNREKELSEYKKRLDISLKSTASTVFDDNLKSGEMICTPELFLHVGYSEHEIPKTIDDFSRLIHPDDLSSVFKDLQDHIEGKSTHYYSEYRIKTKTGGWKWIDGVGQICEWDKDGEAIRLIGVSRDIDQRKKTEEALKTSEAELKEINATKDRFFSIISHDLRSPIGSVMGLSELLIDNYDEFEDAKRKNYLQHIHQGIERTFNLLENLLLWSQSQKGSIPFNPEVFNLSNLCKAIIDLFNHEAVRKTIKISSKIPDGILIKADKEMISGILRNLISNAIKFTPDHGEISIDVRETDISIEIKVIDNGLGIPPDKQKLLFKTGENISTEGTNNEKGSGLGLILCKEFIEQHKGHIRLESSSEKGSCFVIEIPHNLNA